MHSTASVSPTTPPVRPTFLKGDWAMAGSLLERVIAVLRAGKIVIMLPHAVAASAWVLSQVGEAGEALARFHEGEQLLERNAARGIVGQHGGTYRMLGRAALLLGLLDEAQRLGERAVQSSQRQPGFHPRRCICSATSRPTPTGSMPSVVRPITAMR